jgi:hypothetical protein
VIEQLPLLEPITTRTDRTRARCHKTLAHDFRPRAQHGFVVERVIFGFGAVYLSSLAFDVVRMLTS